MVLGGEVVTRRGEASDIALADAVEAVNEVRLVGRVSAAPEERTLPSGDSLWTFRVVVSRPAEQRRPRATVDALECAVWAGRPRRSVAALRQGDQVEVRGALRRRFFRGGVGSVASRVEVEVSGLKVIRRQSG